MKEINLHGFTKQTHKHRSMSQDKGKQNYLDFDNIHLSFFLFFKYLKKLFVKTKYVMDSLGNKNIDHGKIF